MKPVMWLDLESDPDEQKRGRVIVIRSRTRIRLLPLVRALMFTGHGMTIEGRFLHVSHGAYRRLADSELLRPYVKPEDFGDALNLRGRFDLSRIL